MSSSAGTRAPRTRRRRPGQASDAAAAPEAGTSAAEGQARSWFERAQGWVRRAPGWLKGQLLYLIESQPAAVALAVYGFLRAMGVTVQTGQQGLLFSFGRATRVLEPGFHILIPFLQKARVVPNRSRTLDLEHQQVATFDGLVYQVHASLVWRIVDVRRALVEVDDLLLGMRNALAMSVWEVIEGRERETVRGSQALDDDLAERMAERLEPWGVVVERAGFQSIAPAGPTLELLQLRERVHERERVARQMARGGGGRTALPPGAAIGLLGTSRMPVRRQLRAARRSADRRRERLLAADERRRARAAARR